MFSGSVAVLVLLVIGQTCLGVEENGIKLTGCGKTKGCYRNPQGCKGEEDCQNVLTWEVTNNYVSFEVFAHLGEDEQWTAVGFSYDQKMGNDSVADCIYNDKNQSFITQSSYNNNDPNNVVLKHNQLGLVEGKSAGQYSNQKLMCSFSRYITVRNDTEAGKVFDLNSTYYILLARGKAVDGVKHPHTTRPVITPMMINTASKAYQDLNNVGVSGCGKTKGCYRVPSGCSGEHDCTHLITWEVMKNMVNFGISSLLLSDTKWTAVGFSYDQQMGNDSVVDCIYNDTDQAMVIQSSYNTDAPNNQVLNNNQLGLVAGNSQGSFVDGRISCMFSHTIMAPTKDPEQDKVFNLNNTFYLFLARGPAIKGVKVKHTDAPAISPQTVNVCDKNYPDITGSTEMSALVKTHGSLMIIAWMVLSSVAILMPKYFKSAGPESGVFGKALWFQIHRLLMCLSFLLTCIAFVVIFVEDGGYTHKLSGVDAVHPVVGIIVTCLVILNPLLGLARPAVDSPHRPVFYAIHKTLGSLAHVLAAVAMFLGTRLEKASMPYFSQWIVVGYAVWHLAISHLLDVHHKGYKKTQLVISEPENDTEEREDTKPVAASSGYVGLSTALAGRSATVFKTVVILSHVCVLLGLSVTLIVKLAET